MASGHRLVVLCVVSSAAVLAAAGLVVANRRSTTGRLAVTSSTLAGPDTSISATTTVTTVDLVPVVPVTPPPTAPMTTTIPSTLPSPPPSTTTTTLPGVTGVGAVLAPPPAPDVRLLDAGVGCASLADPGWTDVSCGVDGGLTWLTEATAAGGPPGSSRHLRAYVFRTGVQSMTREVALEALDDTGTRFSAVKVRVDDVEANGRQDLIFGFHDQSKQLSIDLVDRTATVVVHRDLPLGAARSATGQLDTWSAGASASSTATSSQLVYEHATIRDQAGSWVIAARVTVPADQVPPSQL